MASYVIWGWVQVWQTPKKITTDRWPCNDHTWPFLPTAIFQITEIQMVILRCLTSLNLNWYKSYDTKCRNVKNTNVWFCTKYKKNGNKKICILCHSFWTNQNLCKLSTSKWLLLPQFFERWIYIWQKMAAHGPNIVVYQYLSFSIRLYHACTFIKACTFLDSLTWTE